MLLTLAKELGTAVAVAVGVQVVLGLAVFQVSPDQFFADPKAWAVSLAASVGRTAIVALAIKSREVLVRFVGEPEA
jgi:hypothetical protein